MENANYNCLLWGFAGDALGAAQEFLSLQEIKNKYGVVEEFQPAYGEPGLITDDSQMTLWTLEGILRTLLSGKVLNTELTVTEDNYTDNVYFSLLRWLATQGSGRRVHQLEKELGQTLLDGFLIDDGRLIDLRAPGNTCLSSLKSGKRGSLEKPLNNSKGCGGIMRTAPCGMLELKEGSFSLGVKTSILTHGHPGGYLPAGFQSYLIDCLLRGDEFLVALDKAKEELQKWEDYEETLQLVEQAQTLSKEKGTSENLEEIGGGWVGDEALAIAVYSILSTDNAEEALVLATNHSGDTDSCGAICGNMLGAQGEVLPEKWQDLELLDTLEKMMTDLHNFQDQNYALREEDLQNYPISW